MRTSGSARSDHWIMAIPLLALLVFMSSANGGVDGVLLSLDTMLRGLFRAVADLISSLL
jgi:hypothetical protein